MEILLIKETI